MVNKRRALFVVVLLAVLAVLVYTVAAAPGVQVGFEIDGNTAQDDTAYATGRRSSSVGRLPGMRDRATLSGTAALAPRPRFLRPTRLPGAASSTCRRRGRLSRATRRPRTT
jgi:hypothetical protein